MAVGPVDGESGDGGEAAGLTEAGELADAADVALVEAPGSGPHPRLLVVTGS